jgi:hypothetical protein
VPVRDEQAAIREVTAEDEHLVTGPHRKGADPTQRAGRSGGISNALPRVGRRRVRGGTEHRVAVEIPAADHDRLAVGPHDRRIHDRSPRVAADRLPSAGRCWRRGCNRRRTAEVIGFADRGGGGHFVAAISDRPHTESADTNEGGRHAGECASPAPYQPVGRRTESSLDGLPIVDRQPVQRREVSS